MLYDSTKTLLRSIVQRLETDDDGQWDDQIECGNQCLFEMHQMSKPLYQGHRAEAVATRAGRNTLPEKLTRAMPNVRLMVIAIRHRDRTNALEQGRAALLEINGVFNNGVVHSSVVQKGAR
jgi:hypothetical protein